MSWLARLKNQNTPDTYPTKPTKPPHGQVEPGFVGFVGCLPGVLKKSEGATVAPATHAANDPEPPNPERQAQAVPDPDRWNWPASPAMSRAEIDRMVQRLALFDDRGLSVPEAEAVADKLVRRDRTGDRRGACAECKRLAGHGPTGWRCTDHRAPGNELAGARLARDWLVQLHHCPGQTT